jgi:hypothetical protein
MTVLGRGALEAGFQQDFRYVLRAGVTYTLAVQSDDVTVAFGLELFDENGILVQTSPVAGYLAACQVCPLWSGPFTVRVRCLRGCASYTLLSNP